MSVSRLWCTIGGFKGAMRVMAPKRPTNVFFLFCTKDVMTNWPTPQFVQMEKSVQHQGCFAPDLRIRGSAQLCRQKFSFGGCSPGILVEFRGQAPVGGLGNPRSWSSLQTLFTDFDCRNDQNYYRKFRTSHLLILDQYVSPWRRSDILGDWLGRGPRWETRVILCGPKLWTWILHCDMHYSTVRRQEAWWL